MGNLGAVVGTILGVRKRVNERRDRDGDREGKGEVGGIVGSHQRSGEVGLPVEVGRIAKAWILLLLSFFFRLVYRAGRFGRLHYPPFLSLPNAPVAFSDASIRYPSMMTLAPTMLPPNAERVCAP